MTTLTENECLQLIDWCEHEGSSYKRTAAKYQSISATVASSFSARVEAFEIVAEDLQQRTDSSEHPEEGRVPVTPSYAQRRKYAAFCEETGEQCQRDGDEALETRSEVSLQVAEGDQLRGSSYLLVRMELLRGVPTETDGEGS